MSAVITINFAGGTAKADSVAVVLSNCILSPGPSQGVVVAMASALTNIAALAGQVTIAGAVGAQFSGTLQLAIGWAAGQQPSVTLNNLQNSAGSPATVTWPTASGVQTQILTPGVPMTLAGIVGS